MANEKEGDVKFKKKPVEIDAFQWTGDINQTEDPEWIVAAIREDRVVVHSLGSEHMQLIIETLEGTMAAKPGDWIIRGVKGEIYPCKPDVFEQTYEPATDYADVAEEIAAENEGRILMGLATR